MKKISPENKIVKLEKLEKTGACPRRGLSPVFYEWGMFPAFVIFFLCICIVGTSYASFEDIGMGARATGMNNAFTAVADDAYAVYYNPAGLNNITSPQIATTYGKLLVGLSDDSNLGNSFLAYSHPLKRQFANGVTDTVGNIAVAWQEFRLDSMYRENVLYLSYARALYDRLAVGANLKILRREFGVDTYTENAIDQSGNARNDRDPVFDGGHSTRAYGVDLGLQYDFGMDKKYRAGLALLNINQPDMALKGSDKIPMAIKLGFLYKHRIAHFSTDLVRKKTLQSTTDTILNAAGERWLDIGRYGNVGVRGGFGIGSRTYRSISLGASYRIYAVQFDYGLVLPLAGIEDTMGSHRVSLSFRFGETDPDDDIGKLLMEEEMLYQEAQRVLEEARKELEVAKKEAEIAQQEADLATKKIHVEKSDDAMDRAKRAETRAQNIYERASKIAYDFYRRRLTNNIGLKEQIIVLEKIIQKYRPTGVSVENLEVELDGLKRQIKTAQKDFQGEMEYYEKMKQSGATEKESRNILNRIIEKYRKLGVDVRKSEEELMKLGGR